MPRNGTGTFSLVSGNPVVTGTTIESNWANTTLSDIATTLTDSLSRSGQGGMTAALRVADGTQGAPGVGFANETGSGFYRAGTGEVWAVVQGAQTLNLDANGVYVPADKATTVDGAFVFNEAGADKDARFEGDTDANLLFTDASTDRVGIGTATPATKLDVVGDVTVSGNLAVDTNTLFVDATNNRVGVGTVTPAVSLDVNGGISIQSANNLTWGGAYGATTPAISASAGFLAFYPNGSTSGEQMRLTSTSLGLGTSSPTFGSGTGVEIERAGIATLRLENSSASNSFELYADTAANGINLRGRDSSPMNFWTGNTLRATLDSSGNLGLGVTPSAWTIKASQVLTSSLSSDGNDAYLTANGFFDGSWKYVASDFAAQYYQVNGVHVWRTAPSGTAGNAISFTQAMTLDASGNLLVGTTSNTEGAKLNVQNGYVFVKESGGGDLYIRSGVGAGVDPAIQVASNDPLLFYTNNTERARITSGGDLLVGRPAVVGSEKLSVNGGARLETFADIIGGAGTPELRLYQNSGNWSVRNSAGALAFYDLSGSAERARINNGGDLLVGTQTSLASYRLQVASGAISGGIFQTTAAGSFGATAWNTATAGDNLFFGMFTEGTATQRGSIDYNRAGGLVRYNTTSDYRAKDILGPVADPGATIDALKVYEGRMKGATQSRPMLVAHEAQEHAPYAVSGVKDEVNDDGTPKFQQIDVSSLVPLLLAEIQSLRARVAALEAA